ncbi:hypothetical protein [Kitasatospora sp. NPDC097643]|uniref:hypothetical protein n=1 Tax=Kitasatospora sp. NPDC097643 TaxID=3157230 RepID=UPI0033340E90
MTGTWDAQQLIADGFAHVRAELAWWDGPWRGLVELGGVPHYFERPDLDADRYLVWPVPADVLALECEQWAIFADWYRRADAGGLEPHPGQGGVDARYDELNALLAPYRDAPADARQLAAEWRSDGGARYRADGADYWVRWQA